MTYALPDLPYDYAALEPHYSARVLELHHDKHHKAYVDGLNATMDKLAEVRASGDYSAIVGLEKTLAFNLSGHVLHSIFWQNLSPDGGGKPDGELAAAIDENFGSFDQFKDHLSQATTTVQGSGWGSLAWEHVRPAALHRADLRPPGQRRPVGRAAARFDAWEHAYYLQYLNVRADYVKAMWNIVSWDDVADRFERARAASAPMV